MAHAPYLFLLYSLQMCKRRIEFLPLRYEHRIL